MSARIDRIPIESSSLISAGYDDDERILEAQFKNGTVYRFFLVPVSAWVGLLQADSKGAYFNRRIRDHYPHAIVPASPADERQLVLPVATTRLAGFWPS